MAGMAKKGITPAYEAQWREVFAGLATEELEYQAQWRALLLKLVRAELKQRKTKGQLEEKTKWATW